MKKAKSARQSSPFKFGHNNIKMLFDHKKMLPRRKCAASVQSYKEDDVDDDLFICEYLISRKYSTAEKFAFFASC